MESKYLIIFLAIVNYSSCGGMLRRTPKVYNALITTDDNLQSSRAFPVIQPTIHETGIAHFPFSPFNQYRFYSPPLIHNGPQSYPTGPQGYIPTGPQGFPTEPQDIPTGPQGFSQFIPPSEQSGFPQFTPQGHPQFPQGQPGFPQQGQFPFQQTPSPPREERPNRKQNKPPKEIGSIQSENNNQASQLKPEQLPVIPAGERPLPPQQPPQIPLNELGFPPSLVPLHAFPHPSQYHPDNHVNLQPYPYNTYPLIYDQFNQFQPNRDHYLPPYGYYPMHTFSVQQPPKRPKKKTRKPTAVSPSMTPRPKDGETDIIAESEESPINTPDDIENDSPIPLNGFVKNGVENKNSDVPDVPPPPLPSGANLQK